MVIIKLIHSYSSNVLVNKILQNISSTTVPERIDFGDRLTFFNRTSAQWCKAITFT